jgi:hypothetical protein
MAGHVALNSVTQFEVNGVLQVEARFRTTTRVLSSSLSTTWPVNVGTRHLLELS